MSAEEHRAGWGLCCRSQSLVVQNTSACSTLTGVKMSDENLIVSQGSMWDLHALHILVVLLHSQLHPFVVW